MLDYGAGDRPYEEMFLSKFSTYIAADYAPSNERHEGIPDIIIKEGKVNLPDETADCVILTEVLEHLYNPREVLNDLHRILKPGGHLIGTVPFAVSQHEQPYDYHRYTYFCLEKMFRETGFTIEKLDYIGDLVAVAITTTTRTLQLISKLLFKLRLQLIADVFNFFIRIPEYIYYFLAKIGADPGKVEYFRQYPLGFTFLLRKGEESG